MINFANTAGTNANKRSREKWYLEFCNWFELEPYPVSEWRLVLYGTFLSLSMLSAESIKIYIGTVCELNELNGCPPVTRGCLYAKALMGIRRLLQHEIKRAQPVTQEMLLQMVDLVDIEDQRQLSIWVSILFGFHLFLRKSNLVPVKRKHDVLHQLSRADIRYAEEVLVAEIKWSKMNQFSEKLRVPVIRDRASQIDPVSWLLFMIKKIPAQGYHNLFSFTLDG